MPQYQNSFCSLIVLVFRAQLVYLFLFFFGVQSISGLSHSNFNFLGVATLRYYFFLINAPFAFRPSCHSVLFFLFYFYFFLFSILHKWVSAQKCGDLRR